MQNSRFEQKLNNTESLKSYMQQRDKSKLVAHIEDAIRVNPDNHAKNLELSQKSGLPITLIEHEQNAVDNQLKSREIQERLKNTTVLKQWFTDRENARLSHDDVKELGAFENLGRGMKERAGDAAAGFLTFTNTLARDFEEALPLGGFEFDNDGFRYVPSSEMQSKKQNSENYGLELFEDKLRNINAGFDERRITSWESVKDQPLKNVLPFIAEQGILSLPDMAFAIASLPGFAISMTGRISEQRAENEERISKEPTVGDLVKAAPAAVVSAFLERLGGRGMLGLDDAIKEAGLKPLGKAIGKAALKEAGTEFVQEGLESAGGTLGTKRGFDVAETLDQMFAGAVAGGGMGAALRGITGTVETANKAIRNSETLKQMNAVMPRLRERSPEKYAEFKGKVLRQNGVENISISGEGLTAYNQSGGDMSWIESLGVNESGQFSIYQAMEGDIELTPEQYARLPQDIVKALAEHTRVNEGMTESEAKEFQESGLQDEFERNLEQLNELSSENLYDAQIIQQKVEEQLQAIGESSQTSRYFGVLTAQRYITRATRTGQNALEVFARDNLQFRNELEQKQLIDNTTITLDKLRSGKSAEEFLKLSNTPVIDAIKERGGIEPDSFLASELAARGITKKNTKGLFKKKGLITGDNIIASEIPYFAEQSFGEEYNGYVPTDTLIDTIEREAGGEASRTADELGKIKAFNADIQNLESQLDELGISLEKADEEILSALQGNSFDTSGSKTLNQDVRASIQFTPNGTIFNLGPNADRSSFLHEAGHLFLEQLRQDQQEFGEANSDLVNDWNIVTSWWAKNAGELKKEAIEYANKANDSDAVETLVSMTETQVKEFVQTGDLDRNTDASGYLSISMHEQWARGVEDYFRTGQAPSITLQDAFDRFRAWLVSIYKAMQRKLGRDVLDVQFSKEVRQVMDKLLATDEEIEFVQSQYDMQALFNDAAEIGMTESQFKKYQEDIRGSIEEGKTRQLKKHLNQVERERMKWWIEERAIISEKVAKEIHQRREYQLMYNLTNGTTADGEATPMRYNRMDREAIDEILENKESAKRLPKIRNKTLYATSRREGSTHPDVIAEAYGYTDSRAMLLELMNVQDMQMVINKEADERMKEKYGDMEAPDQAIEEAVESIHGDKRGDVLVQELNALREGRSKMKSAFVRGWAKQQIGKHKVENIKPQKYLSAEKRYARQAAKAFKSGDILEAQRSKFRQMMNHFMASEAYKVRAEVEKSRNYMQKFNFKRKTFKSIDADFLDRIKEILGSYHLGPRLSDKKRRMIEKAAFKEWMYSKEESGAIFNIPQEILDATEKTHYRDLTLDEYRTLVDSIKNLEAQGRLQKKLFINGELQDIEMIENDIFLRLDALPIKAVEAAKAIRQDPNMKDRATERLYSFDASLRKVEFLLEYIDGEKIGPAHQAFFQPLAEAEAMKHDIVKDINVTFMEKLEALPKDVRKNLGRSEYVPSLKRQMNRGNLLMLALNTGNNSNLDKVIRGAKQEGVDWSEQNVKEALEVLTKEEWDFVQSVWDSFEKLYPQVQEIYRRENGVSPEKIEPRKIDTKHGEYIGRYFPMIYDPRRSAMARDLESKTALEAMQSTAVKAGVFSGMTKARTNFSAPVMLDINGLPQQVVKMAHYISHYEAVRVLRKLLARKGMANAITQKLGESYYRELKSWIGDIASDGGSDKTLTVWDKAVEAMRTNVTLAIMGLSYTTGSAQLLGYSQSIDGLAKQPDGSYSPQKATAEMLNGVRQYLTQKGVVNKVMKESGEMRHRIENVDRDVKHAMRELSGKKGVWKKMQRSTLMHIAYIQFYGVDIPTYLAAKNVALKQGKTESESIKYADSMVRTTQTAGGLKDLSSFQRVRGWQNAFSMFYSFFNLLYNVQARAIGDTNFKKVRDVGRLSARAAVVLILPAAVESVMRAEGPDKDDEENYAAWLLFKSTFYGMSSIPLLRDFVGVAEGYKYSSTPINSIGESVERAYKKISRDIDEGELQSDTVKQVGATAGYVFGVPVLQTQRVLDAIQKWEDDDTMPDLVEFLRGPDDEE